MRNEFNIKIVNDYIKNNNITEEDFCSFCGISPYELNLFLTKDDEVLTITISRIARFLNIKMCDMFI